MLTTLLNLLETRHGEVNTDQICTELGITQDTLMNLLDLLLRKGYISKSQPEGSLCSQVESCISTGRGCPGPEDCTLVLLSHRKITFNLLKPSCYP